MQQYPTVDIKNSVGTQLLTVVFSLYLIVAVAVTLIHMGGEYYGTRQDILDDLVVFEKTFHPGIANQVWNLDDEALAANLQGIVKIPIIVGVKVDNNKGKILAKTGVVIEAGNIVSSDNKDAGLFSELIAHQFPIYFEVREGEMVLIGNGTLYSSTGVVFNKVQYGFLFIIINSIIKTAALWMIFLFIAQRILSRPLGLLTIATSKVNLDNLGNIDWNIETYGRNEIKVLAEGFQKMVSNLWEARKKIDEKNVALSEANHRLELLLESSRQLSITHNKLSALIEIAEAILKEVFPHGKTQVKLGFLDHSANGETGYALFTLPFVSNANSVRFEGLSQAHHSYSVEVPSIFNAKEHFDRSGSFQANEQLYIAAWNQGTLLGYVELGKLEEDEYSHVKQEFIDTLAQTLSIELANIDFNFALLMAKEKLEEANENLEQKVELRTQELISALYEREQQNITLAASNRKLEDLNSTKEQLLNKISGLKTGQVQRVRKELDSWEEKVPSSLSNSLQYAQRKVYEIEEILRPIASLYLSEKAIQSKKVLLAETLKKQQILAKMALKGTGVDLDIVSDLEEGKILLSEKDYDILYFDTEMIELADWAQSHYPHITPVFSTSQDISDYLPLLLEHPFISNTVSKSVDDRTFTMKNILSTVSKLVSQDLFGLEKYLSWGVDVHEREVTGSMMREALVDTMSDDLIDLGIRPFLQNKAVMVAEELLMNAIYDAPTDAQGRALYNHLSRTVPVELPKQSYAKFRYACDGLLLAVSVEDPFGAFARETILEYLQSCYMGQAGSLNQEKGGAGRGIFQIIETADLVVFNVKPKIRTEVIAIFNMEGSKAKTDRTTSLHYFYG